MIGLPVMLASAGTLRSDGHPADRVDGFVTRHFGFGLMVSVVSWDAMTKVWLAVAAAH